MATAGLEGEVQLESDGVEPIPSAPPAQFGGPGDRWSPESLLVASVADCFILSFRAIARASKLSWTSLDCEVEGILDHAGDTTKFTEFTVVATLRVPPGSNVERANRILHKAEDNCLITNSLSGTTRLTSEILEAS